MEQVLQLLGLSAEASLEDVLAAVTEENRASVADALGLPAEATLEEIKAAITAALTPAEEVATAAAKKAVGETVSTIALKLDLGEVTDVTGLLAAVSKKLAGKAGESAQLQTLLKRVGELEAENAEHAWETFLSGPAAGKVTPGMTETVKAIFMRDRGEAEQLVEQLPKLGGSASVFRGKPVPAASGGGNTEEDFKRQWQENRPNEQGVPLQTEFGSLENYTAYMKHATAGHVNILGAKKA